MQTGYRWWWFAALLSLACQRQTSPEPGPTVDRSSHTERDSQPPSVQPTADKACTFVDEGFEVECQTYSGATGLGAAGYLACISSADGARCWGERSRIDGSHTAGVVTEPHSHGPLPLDAPVERLKALVLIDEGECLLGGDERLLCGKLTRTAGDPGGPGPRWMLAEPISVSNVLQVVGEGSTLCLLSRSDDGNNIVRCGDHPAKLGPAIALEHPEAISISGVGLSAALVCALERGGHVSCWTSEKPEGLRRITGPQRASTLLAGNIVLDHESRLFRVNVRRELVDFQGAPSGRITGYSDDSTSECLMRDGEVWCTSNTPRLVAPVQLTGGLKFHCARESNGRVTCWGRNDHGQLGRP